MSTMHKHDAAPPSVQQIIDAIVGCEASVDELSDMIAAALADARREGANAMREDAAMAVDGVVIPGYIESASGRIRALPLPAGERHAVLLTDEQIERGRKQVFSTDNPFCPCDAKTMLKAVRWAEATVLAANNLEVRRG